LADERHVLPDADRVLDADRRAVAVHAGLSQHAEEVGVQAIVLARQIGGRLGLVPVWVLAMMRVCVTGTGRRRVYGRQLSDLAAELVAHKILKASVREVDEIELPVDEAATQLLGARVFDLLGRQNVDSENATGLVGGELGDSKRQAATTEIDMALDIVEQFGLITDVEIGERDWHCIRIEGVIVVVTGHAVVVIVALVIGQLETGTVRAVGLAAGHRSFSCTFTLGSNNAGMLNVAQPRPTCLGVRDLLTINALLAGLAGGVAWGASDLEVAVVQVPVEI